MSRVKFLTTMVMKLGRIDGGIVMGYPVFIGSIKPAQNLI